MTDIDYSSLVSLNGVNATDLQQLPISTFTITEGSGSSQLITYNIGTVELLQNLQTTNVLLCILIVLLFVLTILGSYYMITRILKPYWR